MVGRQDAERDVDAPYVALGRGGVVGVDGADARRVDDLHATGQQFVRELDGDQGSLAVADVAGLGDEAGQRGEGVLVLVAVGVADDESRAGPVAHDSDRRRRGQDAGGQQRVLDERVDERAFAALELAQHGHVAATVAEPGHGVVEICQRIEGQQPVSERLELQEVLMDGVGRPNGGDGALGHCEPPRRDDAGT